MKELSTRQLTPEQRSLLRDALQRLMYARVQQTGILLITLPEEHYLAERTLVETGWLPADRNGKAHQAYIRLLADLGVHPLIGPVDVKHISRGAAFIMDKPFPWQATPSYRDAHKADLQRRLLIYTFLFDKIGEKE